jgi:hypothetical protein
MIWGERREREDEERKHDVDANRAAHSEEDALVEQRLEVRGVCGLDVRERCSNDKPVGGEWSGDGEERRQREERGNAGLETMPRELDVRGGHDAARNGVRVQAGACEREHRLVEAVQQHRGEAEWADLRFY